MFICKLCDFYMLISYECIFVLVFVLSEETPDQQNNSYGPIISTHNRN